jgi:hypothetical protein
VFAALCLAWMLAVHALYFATLQDEPVEVWIAPLRGTAAIVPAVVLLLLQAPVTLWGVFAAVLQLRARVRSSSRIGLLGGALFGLWCNTQFLALPYIGAYPSLPGLILGSALIGGANQGPLYCLSVLASNAVLWALVGWFLCPRMMRP